MILDKLANFEMYESLDSKVWKGLQYVNNTDLAAMKPGKYEIDGDDIFASIAEYKTKPADAGKLEGHYKYIDVQYIIAGSELIGYAPLKDQAVAIPYDEKNDLIFFEGECSYFELSEGMFSIFYPDDLHKPGIGDERSVVNKVVVKIKI